MIAIDKRVQRAENRVVERLNNMWPHRSCRTLFNLVLLASLNHNIGVEVPAADVV